MAKIGFIGTGEIAAAMVHGLAGRRHNILVSERNAGAAQALAGEFDEVSVAANQDVLDSSEVVVLCLLKSTATAVLPGLQFRAGQNVISVMADVSHAELQGWCAPARDICTTIPMPFIAAGGCPLPVFPQSEALETLFGSDNLILPQPDEQALNAHFAASAMASVVIAELRAAGGWLSGFTGSAAGAEAYLIALIAGFLNGMEAGAPGQLTRALDALSTEGGLNATLRGRIEQAGTLDLIHDGLDGFRDRLGLPPV